MADKVTQSLPGFRDFTPRQCAIRNYLHECWRSVAHRYGFVEWEAPLVESTELYMKKTGDEIGTQLFRFEDQGGRDITLRPELTASLARIVADNQRDFPKPLKWFEIGPCFRYEKPQKGRGREFIQFNADIIGEASAAADAELISMAIDTMLELGFEEGDFVVRASDRNSWLAFCEQHQIEDISGFLQIIDKLERMKPEAVADKLVPFGVDRQTVDEFIANPDNASDDFKLVQANLAARGLAEFFELDLTIVRGLAYYTGVVFEIFDGKKSMRAVAGGGRYDKLLNILSDGSCDMPATGFAMGDMVIANFIEETAHAKMEMEKWIMNHPSCEVYVVVADEEKRPEALGAISDLRRAGVQVDYPMVKLGVGKQFKKAQQSGARFALVIGEEFPEMKLKILAARSEETIHPNADLAETIVSRLEQTDGPLIA
ncbi:histidine--tRNA ligase [Persicirhabdus sediminis]|uniref:Histidine--tRNA ligase n=1 Tax=Persicirhabdus sediminis TaxID=454144 RepID=A0A8J7MC82_9BACT|nr:histidine--tRNA ligase [Persicirhabdus sediminis]MBK1790356.1 histidine--tRNA ligase [Persicirhabdus sediminis]